MRKRLFRFFSRSTDDIAADIHDEFAFHVDMRVADLVKDGLDPADARAQALREFGDMQRGTRVCTVVDVNAERQRRLTRWAAELWMDLRFGARLLIRGPGFAATAILTLAVAIGGNTVMFSVVNALALKSLPVSAPEELARVYTGESQTSWRNYLDIRQHQTMFSAIAARTGARLALTDRDIAPRLMGEAATAGYLAMLGVPPLRGRIPGPEEQRTDVVVLSERAWRVHFAGDPGIVGRTISLNRRPYEVLGVMPAGFRGARPPGISSDFWIPIDTSPANHRLDDRTNPDFEIVARLRPGVTFTSAQAEIRTIAQALRAEHPELPERFASAAEVFPIGGVRGYRGFTSRLLPIFLFVGLMTLVAGLVLLIGCANISGLLLGRAAARRREIGVRLALGAGRGRLVRQLLAESLLLGLLGSAAGLLLAVWTGRLLSGAFASPPLAIELDLSFDRRLLAYSAMLAILTTVLCGLAPARRSGRLELWEALRDGTGHASRQRLRYVLVAGQVTVSCALLLWSGLFLRSLSNVHAADPGFDASGVVIATIDFEGIDPAGGFPAFLDDVRERIGQLPGVRSTGFARVIPLAFRGREEFHTRVAADGPDAPHREVLANRITGGWFATVRIPFIAGRDFASTDRIGAPKVAIVNETAARQFWNGNALGQRIHGAEVVGVVRDSKYWTLGEIIQPTLYLPLQQEGVTEVILHVRTEGPAATMSTIRRELRQLAPQYHADVESMSDAVAAALVPARVGAVVTGAFGALGALLTMMGIYGLVSFAVAQRRHEIGIRKAIGASGRNIFMLMLRGTLTPVVAGLTAGLVLGVLGGLAMSGFFFGVSPADPITIAGTVATVLTAALAATLIPARRATSVDALVTLRAE